MVYIAKDSRAVSFIKYFQNSIWLLLLTGLIMGGACAAIIYHDSGQVALIIYLLSLGLFIYRFWVVRVLGQSKVINHYIESIDVAIEKLSISTVRVSAFLGFIKKESILLEIKNEKIRLRTAGDKYGNPKYTGKVCLLIYGVEEYAIAEKFFENFESLIDEVENYGKIQNELHP